MPTEQDNRSVRVIKSEKRVFYDGYWIRHYDVPDELIYKKQLIDHLTRRVFHHTEPGINTPGDRLEDVRSAYEETTDPFRKRVLAAMLAGALLNRGSDILTKIVELQELGVTIKSTNELIRECGRCFLGALEYGKHIRSRYGEEGLDELWGEPFKVFTMPVPQYLETRYIKIAQTMRAIDSVAGKLKELFEDVTIFNGLAPLLNELAESSKEASETQRRDPAIIEIWPRFVAAAERAEEYQPVVPEGSPRRTHLLCRRGRELLREGVELIVYLVNKRIPMPRTTEDFINRCELFKQRHINSLGS